MRMRDFIRENRAELEATIQGAMNRGREKNPAEVRLTLEDLAQWIANDEGLYQWAKNAGVRV